MRAIRRNQKGFTPVEIMIVVAVVGVLAAVGGFVLYRRNKSNSKPSTQSTNQAESSQDSSKDSGDKTSTDPNAATSNTQTDGNSASQPAAAPAPAKFSAFPQGGSPTTDAQEWYKHSSYIANPSAINLWISAKNIGEQTGSPRCTINAKDPNGNYTGTATVDRPQVTPGNQTDFSVILTISNEGAKNITNISVTCVPG